MEASQAPPPFTITAQDHQPSFSSSDPNASVWTIHFQTASGVQSYITVPDSDYNAQNVGSLLAAKVAEIERVQGLGQEG